MATVVPTDFSGSGARVAVATVIVGSVNDFVYRPGKGQIMIIRNTTGANVNARFSGADGVTWGVDGAGNLPVTPYFQIRVDANSGQVVVLDEIRAYLQGAITLAVPVSTLTFTLLNP